MESLKKALTDASIEIYGEEGTSLQIDARHRYHLMDSGVRVDRSDGRIRVGFTVRAQRSDFPHVDAGSLFARIRERLAAETAERGYDGVQERIVEVQDPVDATKLLDVWYELFFEKHLDSTDEAIGEIRWALGVEKYLQA